MFVLHSYSWAVVFCIITMFCWGSWANTQKLAKKGWRFELFYWDYCIGVLLLTLALGLTLGSNGGDGRGFLADLVLAIILDAVAYRKLPGGAAGVSTKGLILSLACGVTMGFFYRFVAAAMYPDFAQPQPGKLGPYAAVFVFAVGVFISNFILGTFIMKKPFVGAPVSFGDYFKGGLGTHLTGILGGIIWGVGMSFNIIAAGRAGFAISYGLGQGATMVAAFWGVFIWKEFRSAPKGTNGYLAAMFACFLIGLALIIVAKTS